MTKNFKDLIKREDYLFYVKYARVPFTGMVEDFHDNGQLAMRGNFKDGKQDGLWMQFWNNGELQMKANFKDGKGLAEFFDEEGNFVGTQEYENGVLQE